MNKNKNVLKQVNNYKKRKSYFNLNWKYISKFPVILSDYNYTYIETTYKKNTLKRFK